MRKNTANDGEDTLSKFFSAKRASLNKLATLEPPKSFASNEERLRHFRLSSKLSLVTDAVLMETARSSSSLAARSNPTLNLKNMLSSEAVGTIKTELGDLDDFAALLSRSVGTAAERRSTVRGKTTS